MVLHTTFWVLVITVILAVAGTIAHPLHTEHRRTPQKSDDVHYIISFGDSYTDTSFNAAGTSQPSPECPLGNPGCLIGGSYTGGHNWLSALTVLSNHSTTVTYNFARSGDVVDGDLVPGRRSIRQRQIPEFESIADTIIAPGGNILWSFFIGINDIGATYQAGRDPSDGAFLDSVYTSYFEILDNLYTGYGARQFLLLNIPDTTRTPEFARLGDDDKEMIRDAVIGANERLKTGAENFKTTHPDVTIYIWDSFAHYNTLLDSPTTYGFTDALSVCKTGDCIWNDSYHPVDKAQILLGSWVSEQLVSEGWWGTSA